MTILLTGASGFVGRAVHIAARARGLEVRPIFRNESLVIHLDGGNELSISAPSLDLDSDWSAALSGVSTVIHCAARVHNMNDNAPNSLSEFRRINVQGTLNLAQQSAMAGVRRFIFISSIKVNGEFTMPGHLFTPEDAPAPDDSYGLSKAEAEVGLRLLASETGLEVTIIRPPLIYGPGIKGNFANLLLLVSGGFPLPLGSVVKNRRSFVALDNLVDLILTCVKHPKAANQTFLISDGEDLSTTELMHKIAIALNRDLRLFPMPIFFLELLAKLLGKKAIAKRLLSSLCVDITKTRSLLGWKPIVSIEEGLRRTVGGVD
ncbi:UDP-glucose 4-epimerase family protein [Polynucleobacter asymbioticus]|uniref:UDP-glucose 4-epimerase family protein n=1 Tax=Polynucleobacter asymbioticus TaxID=576611 RepID=UPI0008F7F028|nr:SDR family oxidoreductase [Polynucleobacter asymbioticus]